MLASVIIYSSVIGSSVKVERSYFSKNGNQPLEFSCSQAQVLPLKNRFLAFLALK